jgi:hypothetical protein
MKRLMLLCALFSGCASTVLKAEDFDRTCSTQGECHPAYFGDLCDNTCHCFNGAVNEGGNVSWENHKAAITCPNPTTVQCDCAAPVTACTDGKCTLL